MDERYTVAPGQFGKNDAAIAIALAHMKMRWYLLERHDATTHMVWALDVDEIAELHACLAEVDTPRMRVLREQLGLALDSWRLADEPR